MQAVRRLATHHHRSPDPLSKEEVRGYLHGLRQRGVARGTLQTSHYGLRLFYRHTFGRARELFGGKRIASARQKQLPDALSEDQVPHLLSGIRSPTTRPASPSCMPVVCASAKSPRWKLAPSTGPIRCYLSSARATRNGSCGC